MRFTHFIAIAFLLSLTMFIGCKGTENPYGTVQVEGTVTLDGTPIEGVNVNFIARGGEFSAGGLTNASGKFTVATGGFTGAKPGEYDVTFSKMELSGQDLSYEEYTAKFGNRQPEPVYLIPQKYENAKTSGIKPVTVATDKKQNVFTFELQSK